MSRYNDNNPQHRKELHEYLTRPKADSKGAFRSFTQAKIAEKKKELEKCLIFLMKVWEHLFLSQMKVDQLIENVNYAQQVN